MKKINKKVLKYFTHPKNKGKIKNPDGYGKVINPVCGDMTEMWIKVEKEKIKDAKFETLGCAILIAASSALTQKLKKREIKKILSYKKDRKEVVEKMIKMIRKELGNIPRRKWHCPPAPPEAFLKALCQYYEKKRDKKKAREIKAILKTVKKYYYVRKW